MTGALSGRRTARVAAVAVVACVLGLLPGSGSAARDQREARLTAAYDCTTPSGTRRAEVAFGATFPGRGAIGKPITPTAVSVRVSLPSPVVAELLPEGTTSVAGTAVLATTVAQGRERAVARWADLASPEVRMPAGGLVGIGFSGDVPHVTVGSAGDVTFTAGKLDLALTAAAGPDTGDAGARPAPAELTCTPAGGADTLLAAVPVEAPAPEPPAPATGSAGPESDTPRDTPEGIDAGTRPRAAADACPAQPPAGKLDPKRLPPVPPGGAAEELEPTSMCAVPAGFATLRKLKSSALVNDPRGQRVGLMHLAMRMREVRAPDYVEYDHLGLMQLPDTEGTFLTFGFQPTTAKVRFEPEPATIVNIIRPGKPPVTKVGYRQHLRLYDVRVNGVPLDVGPRCRTVRPVETELTGSYPVSEGGLLEGELDIPALGGCGTNGEDLDALLSGAVSGPGNALKIRQGRVCGAGSTCKTPQVPDL
ncbi:hypothetical protein GCM10010277_04920 [Streptomyces longisporoflavus]|uniref:DUF6801 domain-containing protein n=1 Tax=Streptomyces longisporoflavus TaxID=28044 RepID=UPI00167D1962|nr:DUF6801 domain-containing protein [Streptomyces longisporoflavus]GGV24555.1 hypothetical protein GCM10010277_04920 [Streptomyces longisporoflavus]